MHKRASRLVVEMTPRLCLSILSVLVGSLEGPADLGSNHDKDLTYRDRDDFCGRTGRG